MSWMLTVKTCPCVICSQTWYENLVKIGKQIPPSSVIRSEAHHVCDTGRRLGDEWVLALCVYHHRGDGGFTGKNRNEWDKSVKNQLLLCRMIYKVKGLVMPIPQSKLKGRYNYLLEK